MVPAIDLALDDGIHICGADQNRLGRRLAYAVSVLREGRKAGLPPIELKHVRTGVDERGVATVTAEFANVVGRLRAPGQPSGFRLQSENGAGPIYRIDLGRNRATVRTCSSPCELAGGLHYGQGFAPYCNVTDEADRSLPVFGPVAAGRMRAATPFVRRLRVSAILPPRDVRALPQRLDARRLALKARTFVPGPFCNRHEELQAAGPALVYFACRLRCPCPMKLAAHLGYDGPIKVWIDGRQIFCDPAGVNPALPDDAVLRFSAGKGEHEIVVALDSNRGAAWGIFLHFERLDVSRRLIQKGPAAYAMPEVLG